MMDDRLIQFGVGQFKYDLTQIDPRNLPSGFGDLLPNNIQTLGTSAALNADGQDRPKSETGSLQMNFILIGDGTTANISQKRREVMGMLAWGEKRLIKDFADGVRVWTWATINNIRMPQKSDSNSYVWQPGQISWSVPKSRWFGKAGSTFISDGWTLDDGLTLTTPKVDQASVGNGSTVNLSNAGNAYAGVYIRWDVPTGVTIINPTITRKNEIGQVVDQIAYTDTLIANDVVEMDARDHSTVKNLIAKPNYGNVDALSGVWLEVPPGTTTLEISGTFTGGNGLLTLDCWDTYY